MRKIRRYFKHEGVFLAFLVPTLVFLILFLFYPLVSGIGVAFTDWDGFSNTSNFVGFDNFKRIFTDIMIPRDLRNTLLFTVLETFFCNAIGLMLATLFRTPTRLNGALKTLVFMPFVISLVLSSYMIQNLLYEVCNVFGLSNPLAIPDQVIPALSLIAIWRDSGYCMIVYVAALIGVDQSFYEAADIEGAGRIRKFRSITFPMIMPAFTANVTLMLSWGLKLFDYSMTAVKGDASESINVYVYRLIFPNYRAGYGQAIALVWMVIIFLITNFISVLLRRREVEL